jgi:uncharacterized protein (DUF1015 family)
MSTAFKSADILIPQNVNMEKWAVVACDQYTSEPEYWEDVQKITANEKSALNLILPEVYLEDSDVEDRIEKIHQNMEDYIASDTFKTYKNAMIYVERVQSDGKVRAGIVGAIDLEQYDFSKGSQTPVRATEATVVERIPPRIKVRRGAKIELPHIMILVDDEGKSVIEPLADKKDSLEKIYDFDLMKNGGHITGYLLDEKSCNEVTAALEKLGDEKTFKEKYGIEGKAPLTYAMGDGNHSLATAKEFYEEQKKLHPNEDMSNAPCRYALAEIVNLHSPALEFEAIHRIVTGVEWLHTDALARFNMKLTEGKTDGAQCLGIVHGGKTKWYTVGEPTSKLTVGTLQNFLDSFREEMGFKIDYIHGIDVVEKLSMADDAVGFILPDMGKDELFPTVICDGALPRKTFSMGHAEDKRFYVEAREI